MPLYLKDKMVSGISLGVPGKSAYEQAKEGGYAGTEEEFAQILANAVTKDYVDEAIGKIPTPDVSGQIEEHNTDENAHADIRQAVSNAASAASTAQTAAQNAQTAAESKAPMYTYGTDDLTAGTSPLATGQLHFVYE